MLLITARSAGLIWEMWVYRLYRRYSNLTEVGVPSLGLSPNHQRLLYS